MTDAKTTGADPATSYDPDRPLTLHPLVYLAEGDEVTIGRRDTDSYAIFPPDGAELVRKLQGGATPRVAASWYACEYGEAVDVDGMIAGLDELGFIRWDAAPPAEAPVRWRRLGRAAFSPPAWALYAALVGAAVLATARRPDLLPSYHNVFFTEYYTLIQVVLFVAAVPQLLLHEWFHALAAGRLGLRARLKVGRRLYFVVLETAMDGLVSVPRRQRYLPILAGMLADVLVMAALTVTADLTREPGGALSDIGKLCLAVVFAILLRVVWQFSFYLRTDIYVLISTVLGCVDLHTTATQLLRNRVNRLLGRGDRVVDESSWHPLDRRAARWYAWLFVVGYTVTIGALVFAIVPVAYLILTGALRRFTQTDGASWLHLTDSAIVAALTVLQLAAAAWLAVRERRRRQGRLRHVIT